MISLLLPRRCRRAVLSVTAKSDKKFYQMQRLSASLGFSSPSTSRCGTEGCDPCRLFGGGGEGAKKEASFKYRGMIMDHFAVSL